MPHPFVGFPFIFITGILYTLIVAIIISRVSKRTASLHYVGI